MIARVYSKTQPIPFNGQSLSDQGEQEQTQRAAVPLATVSWARPALGTHKITTTVRRTALSSNHAAEPMRNTISHSTTGHSAPAPTARRTTQLSAKYLGGGNLSVRSSVTGRHYRFEGHGATLAIDSRDQLMLGRITELLIA